MWTLQWKTMGSKFWKNSENMLCQKAFMLQMKQCLFQNWLHIIYLMKLLVSLSNSKIKKKTIVHYICSWRLQLPVESYVFIFHLQCLDLESTIWAFEPFFSQKCHKNFHFNWQYYIWESSNNHLWSGKIYTWIIFRQ